ncbi:MAG: ankyrin repeat domain-containing protein [Rhodospirillaceae bacterium]
MEKLSQAIHDGDIAAMKSVLADLAVNPNDADEGTTPLIWACQYGSEKFVQLLLEAGADPNLADEEGETPLHVAAFGGYEECVRLLLFHGACVDARTDIGKTPLMNGAQSGSTETVELFLAAGASVHDVDAAGRSALHWATLGQHDNGALVRLLLNAGADVRHRNSLGDAAFDYASGRNRPALEGELLAVLENEPQRRF